MKRGIFVLLFIFIVTFSVSGCSIISKAAAYPDERNQFWTADIEYLQKMLPKAHANLYANITEEDFNNKMEQLKKDIPYINDDEIQIRLMEVFTPIQDAHLFIINFYADMMKHFSRETFVTVSLKSNLQEILPIKAKWFGDELIIIEADSTYKELLGAQIEKIDNQSIEDAISKINTLIPHNNEHRLKFLNEMYISHPQILRHFKWIDNDSLAMQLKNADGKTLEKRIKIMNIQDVHFVSVLDELKEKPLYMKKDDLYWYEYLPEANTVYFKMRTYGVQGLPNKRSYDQESNEGSALDIPSNSSFTHFIDDMIEFMKEAKPEKIVIDIRGNNGGNPGVLDNLRSFIRRNSDLPEQGSVFVLVDKGSFSAPILECTVYKESLKAVIAGEPTGERPYIANRATGARIITLPNSKLSILYSAGEFKPVSKKVDAVTPDIVVNTTFEDYRNGVDPVLKAVLEYPSK